jgi:hypothetical protein
MLAQKNRLCYKSHLLERIKKSNQCFGKRNMEAKSSVEEVIQLDENAELRK